MRVVTEAQLREQLRCPVVGAQVVVPAGARLSPSAADFVAQWQLVVVDDQPPKPPAKPESTHQGWDTPSVFPVQPVHHPRCTTCGGEVTKKPSSLTQLDDDHFALKTHPRIELRGKLDSLHAMVLLVQRIALDSDAPRTEADLGTLAAYCRELLSAEYHERPCGELSLGEVSEAEMHRATHDPLSALGLEHLTIDSSEPVLQHWLNVLRTQCRELEIAAMHTFGEPPPPYGAAICHGLNRLSSAFYFVALHLKAGRR
ncbi:MAG: hypothetical protein Q4B08_13075 [Propionibacteriaceae bacterium]|nr:hypothetical protein [Propionibacteriaceae bacterium]